MTAKIKKLLQYFGKDGKLFFPVIVFHADLITILMTCKELVEKKFAVFLIISHGNIPSRNFK